MRRAALLAALAAACSAPAAQADATSSTSSNWAGYAVSGTTFRSVSGSWKQPTATCTPGAASYSAFWVGLGGFADSSRALEQIGTDSSCRADGTPTYSVWYELLPADSTPIALAIRPGDTFAASVAVSRRSVTLKIKNLTRNTSFTRKLTARVTDVSSAEWIAEAPSACSDQGDCRTLPLANFGTVTFASARATAGGHTGTIADGAWSATTALTLGASGVDGPRFDAVASPADAIPSALSSDGGSFSVTWSAAAAASPPQDPGTYAP